MKAEYGVRNFTTNLYTVNFTAVVRKILTDFCCFEGMQY